MKFFKFVDDAHEGFYFKGYLDTDFTGDKNLYFDCIDDEHVIIYVKPESVSPFETIQELELNAKSFILKERSKNV